MTILSLPRPSREVQSGARGAFLVDPESGLPVTYGTRIVGTPRSANGAILFDIDLTGVMTALVQLTGTWVGTVTFETTIDETNWFSCVGFRPDATAASAATASGTNLVLAFPAIGKRLRARITAYTSGTINSAAYLTDVPASTLPNFQNIVLNAGSNVIGGVAQVASTSPGSGTTAFRRVSTADTNLAVIKGAAGKLMSGLIQNLSAATKYVKLYNKASAPTLASDVPVFTISVFANGAVDLTNLLGSTGHTFSTGIALAITGALADTDTTAVAAGDVVINALYV